MVTQAEAIENYMQIHNEIESIKTCIKNLEKMIELKMDGTKQDITENRIYTNKQLEHCEKTKIEFNKRLIILEQFSSKVFYFYSAVTLLLGIVIGIVWKPI